MALKGSKYSQKHSIPSAEAESASPPDQNPILLDILYDDLTFLDSFATLSPEDQIAAYLVLKKLSETPLRGASRSSRNLIRSAGFKLDQINQWSGLIREDMLRYPLSADEHHIIRMDCYGSTDIRPSHQLSSFYKNLREKKLANKLPPSAYHLDNAQEAPVWQLFRQFQNFREIEDQLKIFLSEHKYDPEILKVMGTKDFSDLIFQVYKTDSKQLKACFTKGDNERNAFVKAIALSYGEQIQSILLAQGWDERCIFSLLNAMQEYGSTDANKIIVTEKYFNKRILDQLAQADINTDNYHEGEMIPQELLKYLFTQDMQHLVAAYDEKGMPLKCPHGFEVHHKVAISESGRLPNISAVNYRNNYLLVSTDIHRNILHLFDKLLVGDGKQAYYSRMEFIHKNTAFMSGFSPECQFEVDWEKGNSAYKKRMEEDQKYAVSYDVIMDILSKNRSTYNENSTINVDKTVQNILKTAFIAKKRKIK